MKILSIIVVFVGFGAFDATAQTPNKKSNYPYYTLSKEVQKIQFRNVEHVPARITIVSPALTQSKGAVQFITKKEKSEERLVVRGGYPAWTISKDVARRQYEKSRMR